MCKFICTPVTDNVSPSALLYQFRQVDMKIKMTNKVHDSIEPRCALECSLQEQTFCKYFIFAVQVVPFRPKYA